MKIPCGVEGRANAEVVRVVNSVDLEETSYILSSRRRTRKGVSREEDDMASLGGRQGWPDCAESSRLRNKGESLGQKEPGEKAWGTLQ